ncbi:MAG: hypothetical protein C5B59_16180 [Bacteroidetes bacterium]|nr:MAG: hypothetical protein C5B59_16180 [Bacteroidota bacterium]
MKNIQIENTQKTSKGRLVAYWILTIFLAFESVLAAMWDFNWLNKGYARDLMEHLGYPSYFLIIKGVGSLLAALVFLLPGLRLLKEWAYFGTFLIYISAIASHLAVGDGLLEIIAPFIFLCVAIASWALRPASRRFSLAIS